MAADKFTELVRLNRFEYIDSYQHGDILTKLIPREDVS
jgi:hypothetical protein